MKTIVLANQKGGVGKTAVATILAQYLVHLGRRVLAVDLDHQCNLTNAVTLSARAAVCEFASTRLLTTSGQAVPRAQMVLVPGGDGLLGLERQGTMHTPFARNFRDFLRSVDGSFDACIVDTHPNPDIRVIAAIASTDFVLSPIQLNQEAIDGVRSLLGHQRVGVMKIKAVLNPKLQLIGLLPTLVEPTPFQRANLAELARRYASLLIPLSASQDRFAYMPTRSAIPESQAQGALLWEMKKSAARAAWAEIKPTFDHLAAVITGTEACRAV